MTRRLALLGIIVTSLCASRILADDDDAAYRPDPDGSFAFAERCESFGRQTLRAANLSSDSWNQTAALLKAAVLLDPQEPRYARLLADDLLGINDGPGALTALKAYTLLKPDDQTAQIQMIDLYLGKMQSADEKIKYLHGIVIKDPLAPEVRSAAAERCAKLLYARSQISDALTMLNTSLELNHLNITAMRLKYDMTAGTALPMDRVMQLLAMLQASPGDPTLSTRLARQLADAGLVRQSLEWFNYTNGIYATTDLRPEPLFACGLASELMMANRVTEAAQLMVQFTAVEPENIEGWLLLATAGKFQAERNPDDKAIQSANDDILLKTTIALSNEVLQIRAAAGDKQSTTRPMDSPTPPPLPDLTGDPSLFRKANNPNLTDQYISAVSSLVWFDLYYRKDVAAADPLLDVLGKFLSDHDVQLARLRGWRKYIGGDPAAATTKLVAVQAGDPLAALGLILIDLNNPKKQDDALTRARQLLADHPSGLVGATILTSLHKYDVNFQPSPASDAIGTAVDNWPRDMFQLITQPRSVYIVNAEPVKGDYAYGEPVLIRVTIENISSRDIAVGSDCALHPDLWFDAYLRGLDMRSFAGAAFDRMGQRIVLPAGQTMTTIVRVDDGMLYGLFNQNPGESLTVNFGIVTNPMAVQPSANNGAALGRPGPGGYGTQLTRMVLRTQMAIVTDPNREELFSRLQVGDGGAKIRTLDVLGAYALALPAANSPELAAIVEKFKAHIRQAGDDKNPAVAAWAKYITAALSAGDDRAAMVTQMRNDPHWQGRLLALVFESFTNEKSPDLAKELSKDKDPIVSSFAAALAHHIATSAATDSTPSVQPAGQPSNP